MKVLAVTLNGVSVLDFVEGLDSINLKVGLNSPTEDGRSGEKNTVGTIQITNSLVFHGEAFKILEDQIYKQNDICGNKVDFAITWKIDKREYTLESFIKTNNITLYEPRECIIEARPTSIETDSFLCLQKYYSIVPGFVDRLQIYKVSYCEDIANESVNTYLLLGLFSLILVFLEGIETALNLIAGIVEKIPVIGELIDIPKINIPSADDLLRRAKKCGFYHPAPTLKSVIESAISDCNITLKSTLLEDNPNLVILWAAVEQGREQQDQTNFIDANIPNEDVFTLLESLIPVYNIDYRLIKDSNEGLLLLVERKDYFYQDDYLKILFDLDQYQDDNKVFSNNGSVSFLSKTEKLKAFGDYQYSSDGADQQANSRLPLYRANVDWNPSGDNCLTGTSDQLAEYGAAAFMRDGKHQRQTGALGFILNIVNIVNGNLKDFIRENSLFNKSQRFRNELILTNGRASLPKLLELDPATFSDPFQKVVKRPINGGPNFDYNWRMKYNQDDPESLYSKYHFIDDPRTTNSKYQDVTDIRVALTPTLFFDVVENPARIGISSSEGIIKPGSANIDVGQGTINFTENEI